VCREESKGKGFIGEERVSLVKSLQRERRVMFLKLSVFSYQGIKGGFFKKKLEILRNGMGGRKMQGFYFEGEL